MMDHTFRKIYEIRLFRNLFIGEIFEGRQTEHVHAKTTQEAKRWEPGTQAATRGREKFRSNCTGFHPLNEALFVRMGEGLSSDR